MIAAVLIAWYVTIAVISMIAYTRQLVVGYHVKTVRGHVIATAVGVFAGAIWPGIYFLNLLDSISEGVYEQDK